MKNMTINNQTNKKIFFSEKKKNEQSQQKTHTHTQHVIN